MYDLCSRLYVDSIVKSPRFLNENKALCEMVERSQIEGNVIVIADRYYEAYNILLILKEKAGIM